MESINSIRINNFSKSIDILFEVSFIINLRKCLSFNIFSSRCYRDKETFMRNKYRVEEVNIMKISISKNKGRSFPSRFSNHNQSFFNYCRNCIEFPRIISWSVEWECLQSFSFANNLLKLNVINIKLFSAFSIFKY